MIIITARQQSCGKIMFSVVYVCHSLYRGIPVQGPGSVPDFLCTEQKRQHPPRSNLFNLDLTIQGPPASMTFKAYFKDNG